MMELHRFEKEGGPTPTRVNEQEGGHCIPVRETLRENGQQRTRKREKENKPKKKQRADNERTSPIANLGAMGEGGGDVVPHMT